MNEDPVSGVTGAGGGWDVAGARAGQGRAGHSALRGLGPSARAARWLKDECGDPPPMAIVFGSGLSAPLRSALFGDSKSLCRRPYDQIPGWHAGAVPGHPGVLEVVTWPVAQTRPAACTCADDCRGQAVLLLEGRLHGYEGYDLSELQLAVRSIARWGVKRVILTCAAGGLRPGDAPGGVILVSRVLDFQYPRADGSPSQVEGSDPSLLDTAEAPWTLPDWVTVGVHAAVPGPQYETEAENRLLRRLGADCVSMSLPAELRAARDEGMQVAALSFITNAGVATHDDVLSSAAARGERMAAAVAAISKVWSR